MKLLGSIKNVMRDGSILLKTAESVNPGTIVYDARGRTLGKVTRVFGPVKGPYIVMRPAENLNGAKLLDSSVYFDPSAKIGTRKKRG